METPSLFSQLFRLSRHSLIYGFGAAASQVIGFFLIPLYTNYLTPADYGILEILMSTTSVLSILITFGITAGLAMSYYERADEESKKSALSSAWFFISVTSLFIAVLMILIAGPLSSLIFHTKEYTRHFQVIFANMFFSMGVMLALLVLRIEERSVRYVVVSLFTLPLSIGLNVYFIVSLHQGLMGILLSQLISSGALYAFLIPSLIKRARIRLSLSKIKGMIAFGLPYVPSNLMAWIMTLSDRYFLQFLSDTTELGLYSLGYKFGMIVSWLIIGPFESAWGPFFWAVSKEKNSKQIYSFTLTYFVLVAMFIALAISVLSQEVLAVMAAPQFYSAYRVVPLIALAYVLQGCLLVLACGIGLAKKTKWVPLITGVAAMLNLGFNYLLIPNYGMMGAAAATVISSLVLPVGAFIVSQRYYAISYEWGRIVKIFTAAGAIFTGSLFISNTYSTVHSYIIVGVFKLLALLTFPILLYMLRFYRPEEIERVKEIVKTALGYARKSLTRWKVLFP